jgi:TatD DNase family protein
MQDLEVNLESHKSAIVGEIGLDKAAVNLDTREKFDWNTQVRIFLSQMDIATRLQRPVSIHSVQTHGYLLDYFMDLEASCKAVASQRSSDHLPCPPTIMLHSFSASKEVLSSLVRLKTIGSRFYFSYSDIVNGRTLKKTLERIAATPENQLLIESDVHNVVDVPKAMDDVVDLVMKAKSWSREQVLEITTRNSLRFLRKL